MEKEEEIRSEKDFHGWFKNNFEKLGYSSIVRNDIGTCPDFIMLKNGKEIRVELEKFSSNFILHGHSFDDVDEVVCLEKDVELDVPVIIAKDAPAKLPKTTSIRIDENLWKELRIKCIKEDKDISDYLEEMIKKQLKKKEGGK